MVTFVSALVMGFVFDFYFDLNDDTMMRDIMAGIYSGVPDGHNMQTLYPLGAFLALCYKLCETVPWYGLFLFLCQFGCFFLISLRVLTFLEKRRARLFALLGIVLFQWGIWMAHMVNVQYTITCAMLSAAAVFWVMTTASGLPWKEFVIQNIPAVLLTILAYQLRTEMLLLTLPFMGVAMWVRWWEEKNAFTWSSFGKYAAMAGLMILGMVLSFLIDFAAYGSGEWQDFRNFFDARTTVYDYYMEVVTDDAYGEGLKALGISPGQQILLRNYNFGLDEKIDTPLLEEAASYASKTVGGARDWGSIFKKQISFYRYRMFHAEDAPYNLLVLLGYAANIIANVILCCANCRFFSDQKHGTNVKPLGSGEGRQMRKLFLWRMAQLVLLACMRTALWMFILLRGRDPERITHSLYLLEFTVLAALLFGLFRELPCEESGRGRAEIFLRGAATLFLLLAAGRLAVTIPSVLADQNRREQVNQDWSDIDSYCRAHIENFYFEDVYSTVGFSDKLFEKRDTSLANYDIAGGWMCKSPLYRKKLAQYGIGAADEALLEGQAYFIMSDAEKRDRGLAWMKDYYAEKGIRVEIREYDRINENYGAYQVSDG